MTNEGAHERQTEVLLPKLALGQVVPVFEPDESCRRDRLPVVSALAEALRLPFPVLSDVTGEVSERYTYLMPGTGQTIPAIFVTDRYGVVRSFAEISGADVPVRPVPLRFSDS